VAAIQEIVLNERYKEKVANASRDISSFGWEGIAQKMMMVLSRSKD